LSPGQNETEPENLRQGMRKIGDKTGNMKPGRKQGQKSWEPKTGTETETGVERQKLSDM